MKTKITLYSHFVKIVSSDDRFLKHFYQYSAKYTQKDWVREHGRNVLRPVATWGVRIKALNEYRLHIGQWHEFEKELKLHGIEDYRVVEHKLKKPTKVKLPAKKGWTLRDYQQEASDFILEESPDDLHSRLVAIFTGGGKTVVGAITCSKLSHNVAIIVLPTYIPKWISDVLGILDIDDKDIIEVSGSKNLKNWLGYPEAGYTTPKVTIISLRTIQNYFKNYEADPHGTIEEYGCAPEEMYERMNIGTVMFDEAHQHLYAVYKCLLYMHVQKGIFLSATFMSNDSFIDNIQKIMFPKELRFDKIKMKPYIKVFALSYPIRQHNQKRIRTQEFGSNKYSHVAFEKSIMKSKDLLDGYTNIIADVFKNSFLQGKIEGDKCAIYAASIDLCRHLVTELKKRFPSLDIRKYTEEDPYENVIESEVRVTTRLSAGTAIDIPNLRVVVDTTAVSSPVSNLQTLGRLRELKDRDVKYCYIYSDNLKKQVDYHYQKKELFAGKVAGIKEYRIPLSL